MQRQRGNDDGLSLVFPIEPPRICQGKGHFEIGSEEEISKTQKRFSRLFSVVVCFGPTLAGPLVGRKHAT